MKWQPLAPTPRLADSQFDIPPQAFDETELSQHLVDLQTDYQESFDLKGPEDDTNENLPDRGELQALADLQVTEEEHPLDNEVLLDDDDSETDTTATITPGAASTASTPAVGVGGEDDEAHTRVNTLHEARKEWDQTDTSTPLPH
jgi:hypothetical protein